MTLPRILTTERLTLRPFAIADLEAYVAYYTGPRTAGVGGAKPRPRVVERFYAMAGQWALRGYGRYAIELRGAGIGHVGVLHMEDTGAFTGEVSGPEMTWSLWDAQYEGKGYATEAARAVLAAWTGPRLRADVDAGNAPSLAVAARLGFVEDKAAPTPTFMPNARVFYAAEGADA